VRPALEGTDGTRLTVEARTLDWTGETTTVDLQLYWPPLTHAPEPGDEVTVSIEWGQ
jgi:hypothetical protein